ncbi:MAG: hypothetical protein Fur007_11220 [Rhodoferax sp.]
MQSAPANPTPSSLGWRAGLVCLVLIVNLVVGFLTAQSLSQSRAQIIHKAELTTQNIAQAVDQTFSTKIGKIELGLQTIVYELEHELREKGQIQRDSVDSLMAMLCRQLPDAEAFRVADDKGRVILGKGVDPRKPVSWADRDYFQRLRAHPDAGMVVSPARQGRVAKQPIVGFAVRYNHPDGRFTGVVLAPVAVSHFADLLKVYNLGPNGSLILRDDQLGLITRVPAIPDKPAGQLGDRSVSKDFRDRVASGVRADTYFTARGADGQRRLASYRFLEQAPMVVVVALSEADYLQPWLHERTEKLGLMAAFMGLSLGLGVWLWRMFSREQRDRAQLQHLNAELHQQTQAANEANASKSRFLATMSHEIRTPMNAILGLLNLLQTTPLTARQLDYTRKSEDAAQALLGIINDILDFSKIEAGKMTLESAPVSLDKTLRSLAVVLAAAVGRKPIDVVLDVAPDVPDAVLADAVRLRQLLLNLASNAIKFTERGEVVLSIKRQGADDRSVDLRFSVQDTGIGVAPEVQDQIFSGFSQAEASTTRRFGGTGLGLAISQRLVHLMGGHIALNSAPGQGSCFSFDLRLPLVLPAPPQDALPGAPQRVLVLDDHPRARKAAADALRAWGCTVIALADAQAALTHLALESVALVLVDAQLPQGVAWQFVRDLAQQSGASGTAMPRVLMLANDCNDALTLHSAQEQAWVSGWLQRPATPRALCEAAASALSAMPALQQTPATPAPNAPDLQGMHLLVVEDNLVNQQVADELLRSRGARVTLADNGQRAVDAVADAANHFDAVLMDLQMPVLDGLQATRIIRTQLGRTDLPIVAMTANALPSDREACLAAGMNDHVGKPFNVDNLVALLHRLVPR